jgi:hypothetical protein
MRADLKSILLFFVISISCLSACDSSSSHESEEINILSESFDNKEDWILDSDNDEFEGSNDNATANIQNGKLILDANQDFQCPNASARLILNDPADENKSLTNITIKAKIDSETSSSSFASGYFRCIYNNIYIEIELSNQNISGMMVFTFANGMTSLTIRAMNLLMNSIIIKRFHKRNIFLCGSVWRRRL